MFAEKNRTIRRVAALVGASALAASLTVSPAAGAVLGDRMANKVSPSDRMANSVVADRMANKKAPSDRMANTILADRMANKKAPSDRMAN